MLEPILIINAGSSSIKFSVFETGADRSLVVRASGQVEGIGIAPRLEAADSIGGNPVSEPVGGAGHEGAIEAIHRWFVKHIGDESSFDGAGHRIVHGGPDYGGPVLIDDTVMAALEALAPLAPLHQPHNIAAIRAVTTLAPRLRQVACFDTAFHHDQPPLARAFALPRDLTAKGIRRYGFHGLSCEYIVSVLPTVAPPCAEKKVIVAHLGNGASLTAIDHGHSVATTMSFTALDGVPMGTRSGSLDPGVMLYFLQHEGLDAAGIQDLLYQRSGLLGVSGLSSDMRVLLASDLPSAKEAVDLFVYRIGRELGSLVAALGGLDALIFTAGIGERAQAVRARVCRGASWLGIVLDDDANARNGPCISKPNSAVSAWVIPTDENLMIARHTRRLLDQRRA
jgi:acetate kinase